MALAEGQTVDLGTLEVIKAPEVKETSEEVQTEEKEEEVDDPDDKEGKEEESDDKGESEKEEEEKEEESDEKKEGEESEKKEDGEEVELDAYLSENFGEKYDIKTEDDLVATLEAIKQVEEENADLRKQLDEAKANTTPVFETDQEKAAFEFLKKYPIDRMGEGAGALARLVFMDVEGLSPRAALEEKFILEHEELTREEALSKFERDYRRKYQVKENDFDNPEEAKAEQRDRDIDLKSDAAKAKRFLSKQQAEVKSKSVDKPAAQEPEKPNVQVQESVKTNLSVLDEYMGQLEELTWSTDDGKPTFTYKFTKQQKEQIKSSLAAWVGNPSAYDAKGSIKGGFDVEDHAIRAAAALFYEDIIEKALSTGRSKGEILRADQIAQRKPTRESKAVSDGKRALLSEEEQWEQQIKAKKKKPASAQY